VRTGAAVGHSGYFHEAAFFGSDDELLDLVVPFVTGGLEAGEPTMVALDDRSAGVVRAAVGDATGVTYLPHASQYTRPALTIKRYRQMLERHVAAGAGQIRAVGSVPHPGLGAPWEAWARYEAAVHRALADLPLWGMCPYDTRTAPREVLADVERLHPHLATTKGDHVANERFADAPVVVARRSSPASDPLEALPPAVELDDPAPAAARRAVRDLGRRSALRPDTVDDLVIAVSEAVANALAHGRPPVALRAWAAADRLVVTVRDRGRGPADPLVGLMPVPERTRGGLGLWIAHQVCSDVGLVVDDEGFTVRLIARDPADAPAHAGPAAAAGTDDVAAPG
jgi:anti-sigma regulatory factor (Ser/Thr protein kinase)